MTVQMTEGGPVAGADRGRGQGRLILSAFFLSGVSALIYQVVWMRLLSLTFGVTALAVTTVVCVFMAGLAIGSYAAGRWLDRTPRPLNLLALYALLELVIGLYCIATPWAFTHLDKVYAVIYRISDVDLLLFGVIRFALSAVLLIFPTMLMGATLPLLVKYLVVSQHRLGRRVGSLYGINTLGAVVGVVGTAFVLIPSLGQHGALWTAVSLNLLIAAAMYLVSRTERRTPAVSPSGPIAPGTVTPRARQGAREGRSWTFYLILAAFGLSGFAALAYEVLWFRLLAMTIGNSVYTFATMLGTFLLGIACGSHLLCGFVDGIRDKLRAFALIELMIGLSVLGLTPVYGILPEVFLVELQYFSLTFWGLQLVNFITAFVIIFVPTLLMGMSFPLVVRLLTTDMNYLGRNVGLLYALNTIGGVVGSFLAGFLLLPVLGLQTSMILIAAMNIVIGLLLLSTSTLTSRRSKEAFAVVCLAAIVIAVFYPSWDRRLLASGVYFNASHFLGAYQEGHLEDLLNARQDILYYKEGIAGTVSVSHSTAGLSLAINGKVTAGVPGNTVMLEQLGTIPLLLHPQPASALLIGLGSGTALAAMERFSLNSIDVVELSAEVVEASELFAMYYHYEPLEDRRVRLAVDDGRNYVTYSRNTYDVIVNAPSLPLVTGSANLFTLEYYRQLAAHLNPGGIVCAWVPSYGLAASDLKLMMRTFQAVFPRAQIWQYDTENIFFVGAREPIVLHYPSLERRIRHLQSEAPPMGPFWVDSVREFVGGLTLDADAMREFAGPGGYNTDDRPMIEYAVPRNIFLSTEIGNYNRMADFQSRVLPSVSVGRDDEEEDGSFLNLEITLSEPWTRDYLGFEIHNGLIEMVPDEAIHRVPKRTYPAVIWRTGEQTLRIRELRRHEVAAIEDGDASPLASELMSRVPGQIGGVGTLTFQDAPLSWAVYQDDDHMELMFIWQCPVNEQYYLGELSPAPSGLEGVAAFVHDLDAHLRCILGQLAGAA